MRAIKFLHDFIGELPAPIRQEIISKSTEQTFSRNAVIYAQGDEPSHMYQLLKGRVKLCNFSVDGREVVTGEFLKGDCFGEMGLIDGLPRVSHAIATEHCMVRVIRKTDFDQLIERFPEFSRQVMVILCRRLRYAYGLRIEASGLTLHEQLAIQLCRLGISQGSVDEHGDLFVSISQEELARRIGASRQSINKELKRLVNEGDVELRYGKIYLVNLHTMQEKFQHLLGEEQITPMYQQDF
ncbi:MAG TPA: Crp/Fnr family transcriptional regulator [Pseudomonadales bacterium]|nr:Crp/Fnr family transcriptional regulator [Pseudomonadales bacterium]